MSETVPFDAFISYSSKDKITADACCAVLEGAGVRCWIAPRDVRPGTEYGSAIMDGIEQSRLMVLIFSSNANNSSQIHREIERAVSKGIPIIPVRIEEVAPTKSMEYFLGAIHWLDALTPPLERHLQQLAETVKAILKINVEIQGRIGGEVVSKNSTLADRTGRQNASAKSSKRAIPSWMVSAVCGLALGCLLAGGAWLYQTRLTVPVSSQVQVLHGTLRAAAQARGFLVGAAVAAKPLKEEDAYRQIVAREFNVVVPENAMKFRPVHPARSEFDFADADTIVQFAAANGIKLRGQPLVWDGALLPWLTSGNLSPSEISSILKEHIQALVGRYRGQVYSWDVVNDAFDGLGGNPYVLSQASSVFILWEGSYRGLKARCRSASLYLR
jgi:hypothetical protein